MKLWRILLALWLILWGLLQISNLTIQFAAPVLGFLAIITAVCLLFDK